MFYPCYLSVLDHSETYLHTYLDRPSLFGLGSCMPLTCCLTWGAPRDRLRNARVQLRQQES